MESRLSRRTVKQSKKQLYIYIGAIVAILFIAINFGPMLIGVSGNLLDAISGKSGQADSIKSNADLQPPSIDSFYTATPSASIDITGKTDYQTGDVEIYVNGFRVGTTEVDNDQTFSMEKVKLSEGDNFIKARVIINNKKSDFSDETKISYIKSAPKLEISNPSDKQSFKKADKTISVTGTTDSDSNITVNGFVAIVDSEGKFSYDLGLNNGDNKITVVATGPSGQTSTKELTVSYSE